MSQRIPKISASASAMSGEFAKSTVVYPCRTTSGSVACPSDLSLLKSVQLIHVIMRLFCKFSPSGNASRLVAQMPALEGRDG
uniref:Uncharacterized protein n=1 Tax=Brassica oleracea var. oleracea TaxID=109376 RepID=A0A0D3BJU3_BRAOL